MAIPFSVLPSPFLGPHISGHHRDGQILSKSHLPPLTSPVGTKNMTSCLIGTGHWMLGTDLDGRYSG